MPKFQCLSFVLKESYISYIICMTVPLAYQFENIHRTMFQQIEDIYIVLLRHISQQSVRKKVNKCFCRI